MEKETMQIQLEKMLKQTTSITDYLDILNQLKEKYLVVLSVKDTPGTHLSDVVVEKIRKMGFSKFSRELWRMYIGVLDRGTLLCDESGEKPEAPVSFHGETLPLTVTSMAWRNGNKAEILINDVDYSVNKRGINIVVYDMEQDCLVDSICYDFHMKAEERFLRRIIRINKPAEKTYQERQKALRQKLLSRPIVIFGAGKEAADFIGKWGDTLEIDRVLTNRKEECGFLQLGEKKIPVELYAKEKIAEEDMVVVCCYEFGPQAKEIHSCLLSDEFRYGEDFIIGGLADALLDFKKIITFVGYCQVDVIRIILSKLKAVTDQYLISYYRMGSDSIKDSHRFEDFVTNMQLCDVLCHVPLFVKNGKTDLPYEKYVAENAVVYTFPYLAFRGLHPYKNTNLEKFNLLSIIRGARWWPHPYEEPYLDKFILEDKLKNEEIYEIVTRDDFIPEEEIRKNLRLGFKMIEISEQKTDCKMLDYIKENYQTRPLYRDCLHYQNCLYFEIVRRMNRALELCPEADINAQEEKDEAAGFRYIDFTEIPVLPCVAKVLGITYATPDHRYRIRNHNGTFSMVTLKEWIFSYLDFTRSMYKVKQFFNLKA